MKNLVCPTCLSNDICCVLDVDKFPAIIFPIEEHKKDQVVEGRLTISCCSSCSHVFLTEVETEFNAELYRKYYYLYPYSSLESMNTHYRQPFNKVFDLFVGVGEGKSLLEIGCSDEKQFDDFINKGFSCVGVSPGAIKGERVKLIDGFYESSRFDKKFDVIVSRFNLEHIVCPDIYLSKANAELEDDGFFVVQVPNFELFVESGILCAFAHEHPQYFSEVSLRSLLERNGFSVKMLWGRKGPSLIAVAQRKQKVEGISKEVKRNISLLESVADFIIASDASNVILYGASLSLAGLLYIDRRIVSAGKNLVLVDDNKMLHGRFMPNSNLKVMPFSNDLVRSDTVVFLILSQIYHQAVLPKVLAAGPSSIYSLTESGLSVVFSR